MKKYIDAEKLIAKIKRLIGVITTTMEELKMDEPSERMRGELDAYDDIIYFLDSLQQEQPDFPTTDEQVKEFFATHPKIEVPEKYKNPDWLFKKQEQPEVDLEREVKSYIKDNFTITDEVAQIPEENRRYSMWEDDMRAFARHFYELGLNARKEEK